MIPTRRTLASILREVAEDDLRGMVHLMEYYRANFIDGFPRREGRGPVRAVYEMMEARRDVNTVVDYVDRLIGLSSPTRRLFEGRAGSEALALVRENASAFSGRCSWVARYLALKNLPSLESSDVGWLGIEACPARAIFRLREVKRCVESMIGEAIDEENLNLLMEGYYILERGFLKGRSFAETLRRVLEDLDMAAFSLFHAASRIVPGIELLRTLFSFTYRERLGWLIAERLHQGVLSEPFLKLATTPRPPLEGDRLTVVFGGFSGYFKNALWQMFKDAEFLKLQYAGRIVEGVYIGWLGRDSRIHRAILWEGGFIVEAPVYPSNPGKVLLLNFRVEDERRMHEALSERLEAKGCEVLNSYSASRRCDSKYLTHRFVELYNSLGGEGILMPEYVYVGLGSPLSGIKRVISSFLSRHQKVVVKPDYGTEGLGIRVFTRGSLNGCVEYVYSLSREQPVVVEELRGNTYYKGERRYSLRVVVAFDGEGFRVESGFCVVSGGGDVAAVSRGGAIYEPLEVLNNTWFEEGGRLSPYVFSEGDIEGLVSVSRRAAEAINLGLPKARQLKYMGLDFVLEVDGGAAFVLLEANARPSGLTYLRSLNGAGMSIVGNLLRYVAGA